jgi:ADP-heptose:LPS heptosyltransferase
MINMSKMHIIVRGGIGDIILLTPTLREIKKRSPDSKLIVHTMHRKHYAVLFNNPRIDLLLLESRPWIFCVKLLRNTGYLPVKYRVASYGDYAPSIWFPQRPATEIIAELMGIKLSDPTPELFLTPAEDDFGRSIVRRIRIPVAIHTTAFSDNKNWPLRKWEALVSRNAQYDFLELGSCGKPLLNRGADNCTESDLRLDFALLKHCKAFIGVESCFAHAAAAFGVPGVVLFGSTSPMTWGHATNINISSRKRCSPCIDLIAYNKCPYGVACMDSITVEGVEAALRAQLSMSTKQV